MFWRFNAGGSPYAFWGGDSTAAAQERGLSGVVIDGYTRDVGQIADAELPVFAVDKPLKRTLHTLHQSITTPRCGAAAPECVPVTLSSVIPMGSWSSRGTRSPKFSKP